MVDRGRKQVALLLLISLLFLSGICFSDEFSYLQGVSESAGQAVQQKTAFPGDPVAYLSDELPGTVTLSGFITVIEAAPFSTLQSVSFALQVPDWDHHPYTIKLFQLLSTYRI